jgi:hypothetical protein
MDPACRAIKQRTKEMAKTSFFRFSFDSVTFFESIIVSSPLIQKICCEFTKKVIAKRGGPPKGISEPIWNLCIKFLCKIIFMVLPPLFHVNLIS